jgi:uncharacterized protein with PIN domain
MAGSEMDSGWRALADEVLSGVKEWRLQHPRASLSEIERALDERLSRLRARLLQDAALASASANLSAAAETERPVCPTCERRLEARGQHTRELTTVQDRTIRLERSYAVCPTCEVGFFPPG